MLYDESTFENRIRQLTREAENRVEPYARKSRSSGQFLWK